MILKWAGGKRRLLPEICSRLPNKISTYYEPFVGGGAVFFELAKQGRFGRAVLSDTNAELINVYQQTRDNLDSLLQALEACARDYAPDPKAYYLELRSWPHTPDVAGATRTICLNRCGYNGLYRVNKSGGFNVPWGKRDVFTFESGEITEASRLLQFAELRCGDFQEALSGYSPGHGDVVYFDPPYVPITSGSFTAYQQGGFGPDEQQRLAGFFAELTNGGVNTLVSNSDTEETRRLYEKHLISSVECDRRINSKSNGRGKVSEILVRGIAA